MGGAFAPKKTKRKDIIVCVDTNYGFPRYGIFFSLPLLSGCSVETSCQIRSVTPSVNGVSSLTHTQCRPPTPRRHVHNASRTWKSEEVSRKCNTIPTYKMVYQLTAFIRKYLVYKISPNTSVWLRGRGQLKCDGTRAETRFRLSTKRMSPFKSAGGGVSSVDWWQPRCAPSAVVMLDTPCSEVVRRVLATHCIRQFPLHFPSCASPCAITFQLESTALLRSQLKCDGTVQNPYFVFRRNGRVHLNRPVDVSSVDWWQPRCAPSAVVMLDTPCSEVV